MMEKLVELREQHKDRATANLKKAQERQKTYYDAKHGCNHVSDFIKLVNMLWLVHHTS